MTMGIGVQSFKFNNGRMVMPGRNGEESVSYVIEADIIRMEQKDGNWATFGKVETLTPFNFIIKMVNSESGKI
jgi:hypothetical protein